MFTVAVIYLINYLFYAYISKHILKHASCLKRLKMNENKY